jgi:hypothetical protein
MQDAQAKVLEVHHPKGTPQDRAQAVVEALRPAITAATAEIVGDLVQPIAQRLTTPA